jgi:hypothetical protein
MQTKFNVYKNIWLQKLVGFSRGARMRLFLFCSEIQNSLMYMILKMQEYQLFQNWEIWSLIHIPL